MTTKSNTKTNANTTANTTKETTMATTLPTAELKSIATAAANDATEVQRNFVAWLAEAGVEADLESVKLAFALRHVFQKSETNQAHLADRRNSAESKLQEQAAKAAERAKKAMERAEKLAAAAAAK